MKERDGGVVSKIIVAEVKDTTGGVVNERVDVEH